MVLVIIAIFKGYCFSKVALGEFQNEKYAHVVFFFIFMYYDVQQLICVNILADAAELS